MADGTDLPVTVVLASASPRRRDLLRRLGIDPDVRPVDVDETPRPDEHGAVLAVRLAEAKCRAATAADDELVVAADTVVVVDGRPLGKPADNDDALAMLGELSGRAHEVVTGVAVRHRGRCRVTAVATIVEVRVLADAEVRAYVATGEPMDKAGGYAIQGLGGAFVTAITGSDSNVVGLPLAQTVQLARSVGVDLLAGGQPSSGSIDA